MRNLVALFLLVSSAASAEPACMRGSVRVDSANKRLDVSLSNPCNAIVTCKVTWRLTCGHGAGEEKTEDVRLDARSEQHVLASASACGDEDWYIAPPRWRCEAIEPVRDGDRPRRKLVPRHPWQ